MIDYDNLLKKIPRVKKILDDGSDEIIYHYTKPEKLLGLLESETLRFSNALYLNDKEEVTYSYKLIVDLIDGRSDLNEKLFSKIREHFFNKYTNIVNGNDNFNYKYEYYTVSFSTESDNLTLWNNYAKGQSYTGYNIGFCKNELIKDMIKKGFSSVYGNVIYDRKVQVTVLNLIFNKWNKEFERILKLRLCHNKQLINSHFYRGVSELPYKLLFAVIYTHLEFRYEVSHTITSHHVHHFHQTRIPDGTLLDYMVQYRKPLFPQFFLYPKKFLPENNPHHKEFHLRPYIQNNANQ